VARVDGILAAYYAHRERAMSPTSVHVSDGHRRVDRALHIGGTIVLGRASLHTTEAVVLRAYYLTLTPAHVTAAELAPDGDAGCDVVESFVDWRVMAVALGVASTTALRHWRDGRAKVQAALHC